MSHNINRAARKRKPLSSECPDGFNPARFPIIARHIFGLEPPLNNGASAGLIADSRFGHEIELFHARGPRLTAELLADIATSYGLEGVGRKKVRRYLDIPDTALDVVGARQLPPLPLHAVQGGKP